MVAMRSTRKSRGQHCWPRTKNKTI